MRNKYAHLAVFFFYLLNINSVLGTQDVGEKATLTGDSKMSRSIVGFYVDNGVENSSFLRDVITKSEGDNVFHLFAHGRPGQLLIEGEWRTAKQLGSWLSSQLNGRKHLNIYGCNFGYGAEGRAAVAYLKNKLGVTVSASDDITGKDGDWELEVGEQGQETLRIVYEGNLQCTDPKKLLGTCDFDGDGILNNVDLDDDNDGIIDSEESPSCFYKESELQGSIKITSQFTSPDDNQTDGDIQLLHDGATTQTFNFDAFTTAQNPTGSNLFTIEYPTPITPISIVVSDDISSTVGANAVVKGSNDGVTWSTALSPATVITGSPVTFNLTNTTPFKYYRIETGSIAGALATANTIGEITTTFRGYGASSHPKSACTTDTDNDGIVNHLDLDSDGDGCFDSYEAGVTGSTKSGTSTDSIATAPYGSNGLANSLEDNDTDTAKVTYNNQYSIYALSKTLNVCADSDNDGIGDLVDIDDDNDGVLDALESPSCYYTAAEASKVLSVSSQLASYSTNVPSNTIDNNASTYNAFNGAINWVGKELYKLTLSTPLAISSMQLDLISWALSSNASQTFKMQGSNDNVGWTDLSAAVASTATTGTFSLANTQTAPLRYIYYRLLGVAGNSYYGGVTEIKLIPYNYSASSYPKSVCTTDTDNDGIVNHLDLDSDGDDCYDSYEAGVTGATKSGASTDSIATGSYGSNGLANSLEDNDTESAKVNYNSKYTLYAISKALNVCADTDNDGIGDLVDIDDDNDGVRDADEGHTCLFYDNTSCDDLKDYRWVVWTSTTGITAADGYIDLPSGERITVHYTGDVRSLVGATEMNNTNEYCPYNGQGGNGASQMIQTFSGVGTVHKFVFSKPLILPVFQVFSLGSASVPVRYDFTNDVKIVKSNGNFTYPVSGDSSIIQGLEGDGSLLFDGTLDVVEFVANVLENSSGLQVAAGFAVDSSSRGATCTSKDTDGDGTPNHLDFDSDGDGCFDSYEAGVTGSTKSGASTDSIATAPYGSNGLANSLEDNDTDTAKVTYNNQYSIYALSKTLNVCADSDNDGIGDLVDIDDDNDGVLDALESPSCYYTAAEASKVLSVSSQLASYSTNVPSNTIDNNASTYNAFNGAINWVGKELYKLTLSTPLAISSMQLDLISWALSSNASQTFKMQGSNDNVGWTDLSAAVASTATTGTFSLATTQTAPLRYTYYRLLGVAGNSYYGGVTEIKLIPYNYSASSYPKSVCTTDTDNDGIVNHLDLDSDGDDCYDSYEAGVTGATKSGASTDSIATGSYGSNGLANSLEDNDTESAKVNYNSKYTLYALSKVLNVCADTDNDGIGDLVDIDDDNDGVLDTDEGHTCLNADKTACSDLKDYRWVVWTSTTGITAADGYIDLPSGERITVHYTGDVRSLVGATEMNNTNEYCPYNGQGGNGASQMIQTFSGIDKVHKFVFSKPLILPVFQVWSLGAGGSPVRYDFTNDVKIIKSNGNLTYPVSGDSSIIQGAEGDGSILFDGTLDVVEFVANTSENWSGLQVAAGFAVDSASRGATCTSKDTDGDGTPNHLDFDSDGDGCFDSYEAGVTGSTKSGASTDSIATAPYGSNGLANSVEDNDTDTAKVTYNNQYSIYALSKTLNVCLDSDGDGIGDLVDIDDDNDGVLDALESPSCYYTAAEASKVLSVSSQLASYSTNVPANTIDNNASTYNAFNGAINWVGKELYKLTLSTPLAISRIELSLTTWALSSNASQTFKMQGSNDNVGWTDLSAAVASTATTGTFSLATTQTAPLRYTYYRLLGVAGNSYYGGVTEIKLIPYNYSASSYPKSVCTTDTDNDGIVNHLDLDSDGDRCFDSYEAGVTGATRSGASTDSIATAPYGSNGLADSLENNDTDSAKVNYANKYLQYAISRTLNVCADTDGDGIGDLVDIDDDNDGILDTLESTSSCTPNPSVTGTNTSLIGWMTNAGLCYMPDSRGFWWLSETSTDGTNENYLLPATSQSPRSAGAGMESNTGSVDCSFATKSGVDPANPFTSNHYVQYKITTKNFGEPSYLLLRRMGWNNNTSVQLEIRVSEDNFATYTTVFNPKSVNQRDILFDNYYLIRPDKTYTLRVYFYASVSGVMSDVGLDGVISSDVTCVYNVDIDTDGDGIPNRLDPDSDGDGCFDSYEAGVTGSTKSGASTDSIATGPYGSNGLASSLENNDTDTAKVSYDNKYTSYALSKTLNVCLDTDNDGISDLIDIDDDNDGVLDAIECPGNLMAPIAVTATTTCCDASSTPRSTITATEAVFADGVQLTDVLPSPYVLSDGGYHYSNNGLDKNIYTYTFDSKTLSGVVVWTPSMNTAQYQHPDGPVRQFTITLKHTGGTYTSPVYTTEVSGKAQMFSFDKEYTGVTEVKMDVLNGWVDPLPDDDVAHFPSGSSNAPDKVTHGSLYNVYLHEFRGFHPLACDTDGDGIPNDKDPDSDGDGCTDAFESGVTTLLGIASNATIAPAPYGPNGFSNSVETAAESDLYKGTYTYANATDSTVANCPKTAKCSDFTTSTAMCTAAASDTTFGKLDCDGDGVINSKECTDGTSPLDPCKYLQASVTLSRSAAWDTLDCDGDDVPNKTDPDPKDPCKNGYTTMQALCAAITAGADSLGKLDCDGDGVINSKECTDGTDPNDPCKYVPTSVTLSRSAAWDTLDCDGDDVPNKTDPDPKDPCKNGYTTMQALCAAITAGADSLGKLDCDGDGVINSKECTDGTDPNDPCKYVPTSATLSRSAAWDTLDCDGDDVPNKTDPDPKDPCKNGYTTMQALCAAITAGADSLGKVDCDGDGVINSKECTDGTDPNDPCKYVPTSVTLGRSAAWDTLDCDGDDVPNKTDPDPKDPCKNGYTTPQALCAAITAGADSLGKVDCDGDGVINSKECTDGTDPLDPCKYVPTSVTLGRSAAWDTLDCDGDDVPNKTDPDPKDPCKNGYTTMQALCAAITAGADSLGKVDCDGDGVINSKECTDGTDPNDPCKYVPTSVTLARSAAWDTLDCDGDDVPNKTDPDPKDPCKNGYTTMQALCAAITAGADSLGKVDCDGDGVINSKECTGGTNPLDPCSSNRADTTKPVTANLSNCNRCANFTTDTAMCAAIVSGDTLLGALDCDGDGVRSSKECTDGTDPLDPCQYVQASVTLVRSAAWDTLDCDGDDVPNKTDPDPKDPCKNGYTTPQALCAAITAGADSLGKLDCDGDGVINSKECTDGTDPNDPCKYVPTSVTLGRSAAWDTLDCDGDDVPNKTDPDPKDPCKNGYTTTQALCAAITAGADSLGKLDCDGDGVINSKECTDGTDPNDPCKYVPTSVTLSRSAAWDTLDCDGDDVPNKTDPDPKDPCKNGYTTMQALCAAITAGADSLGKLDCDGDGVINSKECTDGTDPNDPCKYVPTSVTLSRSAAWDTLDCDGDDVPNKTDPDPKDPCKNGYTTMQALCAAITAGADSLGKVDCDGDGVINSKECTGGTNPLDPCSSNRADTTKPVTANLSNCNRCANFTTDTAMCAAIVSGDTLLGALDCDGDGVRSSKECTDGTDPLDPCQYVQASATLVRSAAWDTLDCDGDDVPNKTDPDPKDPCKNGYTTMQALCAAITAGADSLGKLDCDGDGVINSKECTDGTDPNDPCKYVPTSATLSRSAAWDTLDCDGDDVPNKTDPDPKDPCKNGYTTMQALCTAITAGADSLGKVDCDGDGVINSKECTDGTDPNDPCKYVPTSVTLSRSAAWDTLDCDGDDVPNKTDPDPKDPCKNGYTTMQALCTAITAGADSLGKVDCDGDGVINSKECTDGTDPNDPCKYVPTSVTLSRSAAWDTLDCDGDDVPNKTDPDPKDPCKNGYTTTQALCAAITAGADSLGKVDCDGDGVINSKECTDGTDPNDPCKYVPTSVTLSRSAVWDTLDCDGDDVPNKTDPDPKDPCKNGYTTMQALCTAITAGADSLGKVDCDGDGVINSKECTGGTNPLDPCSSNRADTTKPVTANLSNCNRCANFTTDTAMCAAIVSGDTLLGALDCDGDGVRSSKECTDGTDPLDPCQYVQASATLVRSAAWDTLDCDGDDVPNKTDPDPKDPCKNGYTTMQALCAAITAGADSLGKLDCDGDGVINSKECTDGTDPNDPCKYVPTSATLSRSAAWDTLDCDGDDVPNKTDPDPKDPCKNGYTTMQALCTAITAGADSLGKVDCDGDGVINSKECTDGTDPNDPCKYVPTSVTLSRSAAWDTLDCDGDDVPNKTDPDPKDPCKNGYTTMQALCTAITAGADSLGKVDCDGDGVINSKECTDGTDPNDPCKYVPTSVTLLRSAAWDTLDCDGDDVPNKTDPDPKDPCKNGYTTMQALCAAITAGADSLGKLDCDGDGVINSKECTDGTDPLDPCKYVPISVTLSRSAAWDTLDCDGDDVPNKTDPDPKDPCKNGYTTMQALCAAITAGADSLGKVDCDGDGVINSKECTDGTDPNDPCKYVPTSVTLSRSAAWDTLDCDGDDVPNKTDPDPKDPCKNGYTTMQALCAAITAGADSLGKVDCDGDGVINSKECTDGTDPNDPCKYVPTSVTLSRSAAWDTLDCDGDDVPNKTDPDPKDPCKNGYTTMQALCAAITAGADSLGKLDCDGDGVINSKECTDGTDPNDPCKYVPTSVTLARSAAWDTLDCDGDDVPNKTDPDPKDPCKNGYTTFTQVCAAITAGADSLGKVDCDGDGVINSKECTGGTDPLNPCSRNASDQTLTPTANLSACCPTLSNNPSDNTGPTSCGTSNGTIRICGLEANTSGYTLSYMLNGGAETLMGNQNANTLGCIVLSNLAAGSYTNIYVKTVSCEASNKLSAILLDPGSPTIGMGSTNDPTICGAADGSFTLTGLAPNATYKLNYNKDGIPQTSFSFTSVSTSYVLTGLTEGEYTGITVTSNNCKSNAMTAKLTDPAAPNITVNSTAPTSCGLGDAQMTIKGLVSGREYTFIYTKDGISQQFTATVFSNSYTFSNLKAGDYRVKVRSGKCNSNEEHHVISDPKPVTISVTGTNPSTCDGGDGLFTITGLISGTDYILNYVKDGVQQAAVPFTASSERHTILGFTAGVYSGINVTQNKCTSNTAQLNLMDPEGTQISAVSYAPTSCTANDGRVQIVGLIPGTRYLLKYSKDGIAQTDISFTSIGTSYELKDLMSAKYTNIRVDQASCISNSVNVDFTCNPCFMNFPSGTNLCNAVNSGNLGLAACDHDGDGVINSKECTGGTDPLNPCSRNASDQTLTPTANLSACCPTLSNNPSDNTGPTSCGTSNGTIRICGLEANTSGYTLSYMLNGGAETLMGNQNANTLGCIVLSNLAAGSYTNIYVKTVSCEASNKLSAILLDPGSPTIGMGSTNDPTICGAADGSFTLTGLAPNATYKLNYNKDGIPQTSFSFTSVSTSYVLTGLTEGEYTGITVTSNSCKSNAMTAKLTDPAAPNITVNSTAPTSCGLGDAQMTIKGLVSGREYTFIYTKDGISQQFIATVFSNSYTFSNLKAGDYRVKVRSGKCNSNEEHHVISDPKPVTISVTGTNPSTCDGGDGLFTITGLISGTDYILNYVKDGVQQAAVPFTASSERHTILGFTAGVYSGINVTQNKCTSNTAQLNLMDPEGTQISAVSYAPTSCTTNDGRVQIVGLIPGTRYLLKYSKDGIAQTDISFTSIGTSYELKDLMSAKYTNIRVDQASCISNSVNVDFTCNPCFMSFSSGTSLCNAVNSGNLGLAACDHDGDGVINSKECTGGTDPLNPCSRNASDQTLTPTANLSACCPTLSNNPSDNTGPTSCGTSNGTIRICGLEANTSGYTLSYMLNGGAETLMGNQNANTLGCIVLSNLAAGSYTNIYVKTVSCEASNKLSAILSDPASPTIGMGSTNDPTICGAADGSFTLTGLAPNATYKLNYNKDGIPQTSFSFTSVSTSYVLTGLTEGEYTGITVTSNNCKSNAMTAKLTDPAAPNITVSSTAPTSCGLGDAQMTIKGLVSGREYTFIYTKDGISQQFTATVSSNSYTFSNLKAGDYRVKVRSGKCNSNEEHHVISDSRPVTISVTGTNPSTCDGGDGLFTITGLISGTDYILNYVKDGVQQAAVPFTASSERHTILGFTAGVYSGINVTQNKCTSNTAQLNLMDPEGTQISAVSYAPTSCTANDGRVQIVGLIPGTRYLLKYSKDGIAQTAISFTSIGTSYELKGLLSAKYTNIRVDQASCISNSVNVDFTCNPCLMSFSSGTNLCNAVNSGNLGLAACDHDGDGVTNKDECTPPTGTPPTDPLNPCSRNASDQTLTPTANLSACCPTLSNNPSDNTGPTSCGTSNGTIRICGLEANTSGYTLSYMLNGGAETLMGNQNANTLGCIVLSNLAAGSYTNIYVKTVSCEASNKLSAILSGLTSPTIGMGSTNDPTICGGADGSFTLTGLVTGSEYTLNCVKDGEQQVAIRFTASSTSHKVTGFSAGVYSGIRVMSQNACLSNALQATLVNSNSTQITMEQHAPTTCISNDGRVIISGLKEGVRYLLKYSKDGIAQTDISFTSIGTSYELKDLMSAKYTNIRVDQASCISNSVNVDFTCNPCLMSFSSGTNLCNAVNSGNLGLAACDHDGDGVINSKECTGGTDPLNPCSRNASDITKPVTVPVDRCGEGNAKLLLKVMLQGALFGNATSIMRDDLRKRNVIPSTEPYSSLGVRFKHVGGGGEALGATALTDRGTNSVVDWVFVELRDASNSSTVVQTVSALVQRDGDVVSATDGMSPLTFSGRVGQQHFVSVKHRNHLGTMTAAAVTLTEAGSIVDFTKMSADSIHHMLLGSTNYNGFEQTSILGTNALWAGNVNNDSRIKNSGTNNDRSILFSTVIEYPLNTGSLLNIDKITPVYMQEDVNMDAKVKYNGTANDTNYIYTNVVSRYRGLNTAANANYDLFVEQLP